MRTIMRNTNIKKILQSMRFMKKYDYNQEESYCDDADESHDYKCDENIKQNKKT